MPSFFLFCLLACLILQVEFTQVSLGLDVTWFSDFHYDPLYGMSGGYGECSASAAPNFGKAGCDAPFALIQSALNDASNLQNAFTIFGGDWQRHGFPAANISTTAIFTPLSKGLANVKTVGFPAQETVDIGVTLGNNDFIRDYFFNYTDPVQTFLGEQVDVMETNKILSSSEGNQMHTCGFYSTNSSGFRVITFNAFLWTYSIIPSIPDDVEDPCGQFAYMESELSKAETNGDKVIVLGHVPPSVNAYRVISRGKMSSVEDDMYWKSWYLTRYMALLKKYNSTVVTHLYGHTHVFAVLAFEEAGVPGFVIPSISPVFGNNPSYLIASFSEKWELEGLRQRYFSGNGEWKEGVNVIGALGLRFGFSNFSDLRETLASLWKDSTKWSNYLSIHSGESGMHAEFPDGSCDSPWCRCVTICTMLYADIQEFEGCTKKLLEGNSVSTSVAPAVLLIAVSLIFSIAVVVKLKYPTWRQGGAHIFPDIDWTKQLFGRSSRKALSSLPLGAETEVEVQDEVPFSTSQNHREEAVVDPQESELPSVELFTPREVRGPGECGDGDDERLPQQNVP